MLIRRSALVAQPATHLFDIIEAAEHYPQFLPWCAGAQIISRDESMVSADIRVRWGGVKFEFRTRNPKQRPEHMSIHLEHGPFRRFQGEWRLTALTEAACKVEFALDYEFESALMTRIAGPTFDRVSNTLVDAFVQRALALPPAPVQDAALGVPTVGGPALGGSDG
jgi:ribosome-associated toxin RatA of RatAB toxin-antitoxin module